jgi:hypothetical protein
MAVEMIEDRCGAEGNTSPSLSGQWRRPAWHCASGFYSVSRAPVQAAAVMLVCVCEAVVNQDWETLQSRRVFAEPQSRENLYWRLRDWVKSVNPAHDFIC